jgi:hypothetical protein
MYRSLRVYYVPSTPERLRSSKFSRPESDASASAGTGDNGVIGGISNSSRGGGGAAGADDDSGSEGELQICFHVKEAWNLNEVRCT